MRSVFGVFVVTGALFVSSPARAEDGKGAAPAGDAASAARQSASPREAPKVIVAVDPVTGELRPPTAAERKSLEAGAVKAFVRIAEPTRVETLPDGRVRARLGPEYFRYSVARVAPDGALSSECVSAGKVETALAAAAPPAPASKPAAEEK